MEDKKLKVVWICSVSNVTLRHHLDLSVPLWHRVIRSIMGSTEVKQADYAQWNSNAIEEFERFDDIDLHIIFVHGGMRRWQQRFEVKGIHYYAVSKGDTRISTFVRNHLFKMEPAYARTHRIIAHIVNDLHPDIIHIMGAENPPYSPSIHLLSKDIPIIVQLQTLLSELPVEELSPQLLKQRDCECGVLKRTDYIGKQGEAFTVTIRKTISPDAIFVNTRLVIGEKPNLQSCEKTFDFVYFASFVSKSLDLALEAFGIAYKKDKSLTLDVVGGINEDELVQYNKRLDELGCKAAVTFEGRLATHEDVIEQIRKARYALLPLKFDLVSGTIREAMWNGLPVITTITQGTPFLNERRESVLLSEIGNHEAMADNMLLLTGNTELANRLRQNAAITVEERYGDNTGRAREWVSIYKACIEHFSNGTPLPDCVRNIN